jgi:hypothetical protein
MKSYLVVRHHRESDEKQVKAQKKIRTKYAYLEDEPVRFDIQKQIVGLLSDRMKTIATTDAQRHEIESLSPLFTVQQFHVADGSLRYYARAGWKPRKGARSKLNYGGLGAWIALLPTLHIVAAESVTEFEYLPELLNVIDLGGGDTAPIASQHGDDSAELNLVQYRDGVDLRHMPTLQSIGAGE